MRLASTRYRRVIERLWISIAAAGLVVAAPSAPAGPFQTLHSFAGDPDGQDPLAGLIMDKSGALYGTTAGGGAGYGIVFKLTPPATGRVVWTETVLHHFSGGDDGGQPYAGLMVDKSGNLYGTTYTGGNRSGGCSPSGCGVVFKLAPPAAGETAWTETVLHAFSGPDGKWPFANVIADASGALYGTTYAGGAGSGVVFKLIPPAPGKAVWTEAVLHSFSRDQDGALPAFGVKMDASGALYGTTTVGGANAFGVVFKLTPPARGLTAWTETVLHAFGDAALGRRLWSDTIIDTSGAIYGTAAWGGTGSGVVFKLTPPAHRGGAWKESVLHTFSRRPADGSRPVAGLLMDASGALYGTASAGGRATSPCYSSGCGIVFKLVPPAAGRAAWTEIVLHRFSGGRDGMWPYAGLIQDGSGALYGTAGSAGMYGRGTVFRLTP